MDGLTWLDGTRHGGARLGAARMAWRGEARRGKARHGLARPGMDGTARPERISATVDQLCEADDQLLKLRSISIIERNRHASA